MAQCHYSQGKPSEDGKENFKFPKAESGMVHDVPQVNKSIIKVTKASELEMMVGGPMRASSCKSCKIILTLRHVCLSSLNTKQNKKQKCWDQPLSFTMSSKTCDT